MTELTAEMKAKILADLEQENKERTAKMWGEFFKELDEMLKRTAPEREAKMIEAMQLSEQARERREKVLSELSFRGTCKGFDDKIRNFTGYRHYCWLPTVITEDINSNMPAVFVQVSDWVDVIEHDDDPDRDPDLSEEYDAYFLVNNRYKYYTQSFCGDGPFEFTELDIEANDIFTRNLSRDKHYITCADWDDYSGAPLYAEFNEDGTRVRLFLKRLTW